MARHRMVERRDFLKQVGVLGATFAIGGTKASGRVIGANDRVRVAVAGLHGRGEAHVSGYAALDGVEVTYLVDPDTRTFETRCQQLAAKGRPRPKLVQDIRKALDDGEVDAVSIATPNHWHALMTVWACQAGKDVYVEKPASHDVHEGRVAVAAARKYDRVVQHGTQGRSDSRWAKIAGLVRSGKLGELRVSRALCYKSRPPIGKKPTGEPPKEVDFDLWLGPAPEQPFHTNLVHYNWHWFWDFGNGDIGNQGVHQMDIARWMIPDATWPRSVVSLGGRMGPADQGQTPNTQVTLFDYGPTRLVFEVRGMPTDPLRGEKVGNILEFDQGTIVGNTKFFAKGSDKAEPIPGLASDGDEGGDHFANFIAACRSRRTADLKADILEAHYSSGLCHLANISYRLGEPKPFAEAQSAFESEALVAEALERAANHLFKTNGLSPADCPLRVGRRLVFAGDRERFVDDKDADALLSAAGRGRYRLPDSLG